jgi:hypothetical protein
MKKKTKKAKNTVSIFGKTISSNNFFALVLCVVIGIVMICRSLYVNQKLSENTETVMAEVIDIYWSNHGQRLWGYEMKYKYEFRGREVIQNAAIQKNEIDKIHIGDCIEVIISLDDDKVRKWNKSKGTFKCQ